MEQGLGGAIYINGNNSDIAYCYFENNIARNGSAVYNRGQNLTIEDDTFIENQAWSYLLTTVSDKKRIYYDPEGVVIINVTHKGGDNIINAIHNDGKPEYIFFYNVTYESSVNKTHNTGNKIVNPVDGVENSKNGTLIYQDAREDLQNITIILTHLETGNVIINFTSQTVILGNISVSEKGLLPGNYSVNVTHIEDGLYKFITNMTYFEILPVADLAVEKSVSNKAPDLGEEIVWTIKVTNNGYNDATNAYVIDKLPDGLIFAGSDGNYNASTGRWEIGDISVGETLYLNIKTIVNISNTTILNVATVNSSTYDPNETNNIANNTTKSNTLTDLSVVKLVSKEISVIGDEIVWTIIVTNNGPNASKGVYVVDRLPSGLVYQSDDSEGKYNSTSGVWTVGDLAIGANATLVIKTLVNISNSSVVNVATVNASTFDPNETNNVGNNTTDVNPVADLSVVKLVSDSNPNVGDVIEWTIIVTNNGPDTSKDVRVVDKLPSGLVYQSDDSEGKYNSTSGVWTVGDLAIGANATLVIKTLVNISGISIVNVATVNGSTYDPNETNNVANNTTDVNPVADLSVVKLVSDSNPNFGDVIEWTIIVTNNGPNASKGVYVVDKLPSGLVYQSDDSKGKYNPNTGVWTVGDLANGSTATLVIKTLVNIANSSVVNVATVNGSTFDPNETNNNANNSAAVNPAADLIISKVVLNIDGDKVSWSIYVKNLGPDTAINTRVVDVLPNTLQFVSYNATKGSYDSITGVWSIGDMLNGEEVSIIIETIAIGTGEIINEARVESDTYDPNMTNNYDYDVIVVEENISDVEPVNPPESIDTLPAAGNPLIVVLLALIALGTATLRRRK